MYQFLLFCLACVFSVHCHEFSDREMVLIEHVKKSMDRAEREISKIDTDDVLKIHGMSGTKGRHLLNNLCSLEGANYLEIGVWKGSTLIAALYNNEKNLANAVAIDDWSQRKSPSTFRQFIKNILLWLFPLEKVKLRLGDAREVFIMNFDSVLDDLFITVVDDWNWKEVRSETLKAFQQLGYQILYENQIRTDGLNKSGYWNGLYIGVIKKPKVADSFRI